MAPLGESKETLASTRNEEAEKRLGYEERDASFQFSIAHMTSRGVHSGVAASNRASRSS